MLISKYNSILKRFCTGQQCVNATIIVAAILMMSVLIETYKGTL